MFVLYGRFQWSIPEPDQKFISVEPDAGELHPNESSVSNKSVHAFTAAACLASTDLNYFTHFITC